MLAQVEELEPDTWHCAPGSCVRQQPFLAKDYPAGLYIQVDKPGPVSVFAGICYLVHLAQQSTVLPAPEPTVVNSLLGLVEPGLQPPKDLLAGTGAAALAVGLGGRPVQLRWVPLCSSEQT
jgi:hypothetical protein